MTAPGDVSRYGEFWLSRGLSRRVAWSLAATGIGNEQELRDMGRLGFLRIPNCGNVAALEIANKIGWYPPEPKQDAPEDQEKHDGK